MIAFRSSTTDKVAVCGLPGLIVAVLSLCSVVQAQDDVPRFRRMMYSASVMENAAVGTSVVTVMADPAASPPTHCSSFTSITYSTRPIALQTFSIESNGAIVVTQRLDFETQQYYTFNAIAYDGCSQATTTVNITVVNVDDSAPECLPGVVYLSISESLPAPFNTTFGLGCTDPDNFGSTVVYTIAMGNDMGEFDVSDGYLSMQRQLDYELKAQHLLVIHVSKVSYPSAVTEVTVVVTVLAYNEFSPVFTSGIEQFYNISESLSIGTSIANITARDNDGGCDGVITYLFSSAQECFTIDPVSGNLALLCSLDREVQSVYNVTIMARDNSMDYSLRRSSNITIHLNVLDANDNAPSFLQGLLYTFSVLETTTDVVLLTLECVDADEGTNADITYEIVDGNSLNQFSVDLISGSVTVDGNLDYESQQFHRLTIQCLDNGPQRLSSVATVIVQVLSVNEHDPVIQLEHDGLYHLAEDSQVGTMITTVSAVDMDSGLAGELVYRIDRSNDSAALYCPEELFQIDPTSGSLYLLSTLDKESDLQFVPPVDYTYECSLVVSNRQPNRRSTGILKLAVENVNDVTPVCNPVLSIVEVLEDFAVGDNVCSFACQDGDSSSLAYDISDHSIPFTIVSNLTHGIVQLSMQLDYEARSHYSFNVTVSDMGIPPLSTAVMVHVNVKDINEHVPLFSTDNDSVTVPENTTVGTALYVFSASDYDTSSDLLQYSIIERNDNDLFALNELTGVLYLAMSLDREAVECFYLTVQAEDVDPSNSLTGVTHLNVCVSDINDNAPVFSSAVYFVSLAETVAVGSLFDIPICTDNDDGINSLLSHQVLTACSYANGASSCVSTPNNSLPFSFDFTIGEAVIRSTLDYESATLYRVEASCADQGIPQLSTSLVIYVEVEPVNEFVPSFDSSAYDVSVAEDIAMGSSFFRVNASDLDSGLDGELFYSLISGLNHFAIDLNTGELSITRYLDRECEATYTLEVTVSDRSSNGSSACVNVYITVDDVNDNMPKCRQGTNIIRISELTPIGSSVIQLNCSDADQLNTLHYAILSGNEEDVFSVHDNGSIVLSSVLNMDDTTLYHMVVSVTDSSFVPLSVTVDCFVYVTRANHPPVFSVHHLNVFVPLSTVQGSLLLTVNAIDGDEDIVHYSMLPPASFLAIDQWNGEVFLITTLQRSQVGTHRFALRAEDAELYSVLNLTVEVTDDITYSLMFDHSLYFASVAEDTRTNASLLSVHCTNDYGEDVDNLQYHISEPSPLFHIAELAGLLSLSGPLDFELKDNYSLSVVCSDPIGQLVQSTATVLITVLPVNEHAPLLVFNSIEANVTENSSIGQLIIHISATDQDRYSQLRYYLNDSFGLFYLDEFTGALYLIQPLDFESQAAYNLVVTAVDEAPDMHSSSGSVIIHVIDSNDHAPYCDPSFVTKVVSDNAQVGQAVTVLNCIDNDSGSNSELEFTVMKNDTDMFTVNQNTGEIIVARELVTSTSSCFMTVLVSDKGTPSLSVSVAVELSIQKVLQPRNDTSVTPPREVLTANEEGKNNSLHVTFAHLTHKLWETGAKEKFLIVTAKAVTYFCAINSLSCSLEPYCIRNIQDLNRKKRSQILFAEFSNESVVFLSENVSNGSLSIQFYINLPEEVNRPEDAATTHVLPLATLKEVFNENGDVIMGYTLSSALTSSSGAPSVGSPTESQWRQILFGSLIAVAFIVTSLLCLGLVAYKWKRKKSVKVSPILKRDVTVSTLKSTCVKEFLFDDTDIDMASMENHGRESSELELKSYQSSDSLSENRQWPWVSTPSLRPLVAPKITLADWANR